MCFVMAPDGRRHEQMSEDVENSIKETHLCSPCSVLFQEKPKFGYHIHHESYSSFRRSLETGCRLCARLEEGWDYYACDKELSKSACYSVGWRWTDKIALRIRSETFKFATHDMWFKITPDARELGISGPLSKRGNMDTLLQWFRDCTGGKHPECNTYREQSGRRVSLPSRLLYFPSKETGIVRLVEVQRETSYRYATLSHRWGEPEPHKLTHNTSGPRTFSLDTAIKGIPISGLPRIFRQAFEIIHVCELEYLWIDSLCIIQDKDIHGQNRDWDNEAAKVGDIYAGGVFNIAAIGKKGTRQNSEGTLFPEDQQFFVPVVRDHFEGLEQNRDRKQSGMDEPEIKETTLVRVLPNSDSDFERQVVSSELLSRGWVYQEVILAPAILFCTTQQMWWLCHEDRYCESHFNLSNTESRITRHESRFSRDLRAARRALSQLYTTSRNLRAPAEDLWAELIPLYIKTSVTRKDDRLVAIHGLFKALQSVSSQSLEPVKYHSGVWSTDIIPQLNWVSTRIAVNRFSADHYIPSWSPFSSKAEIATRFVGSDKHSQLPIGCTFETSGLDKFGRAKSIEQSILHLRGVPIGMSLSQVTISGRVKTLISPLEHPGLELEFHVTWDNQAAKDSAHKAASEKRLRALILNVHRIFGLSGLLIMPFQDDNAKAPTKWVRCGHLSCLYDLRSFVSQAQIIDAFQFTRYGITWEEDIAGLDSTGWWQTGVEPELEDIYLV